jgi:hypothetical protein
MQNNQDRKILWLCLIVFAVLEPPFEIYWYTLARAFAALIAFTWLAEKTDL